MNKASISNRIYMNCDLGSDLDLKLCEELTYEISQEPVSEYPLILRNLTRISDKVISIPSGRLDLIPEDYVIIDKRVSVKANIPEPSFTLRASQQACVDMIRENGLINAPTSWGKSIAGLGIARKLGEKTLIITTTTTIRDMWFKEIKKWMELTPGIIGSGKFEIDAPIVVGNIQTIRNKATELANTFGLIIVDEVHRSPAKTFTNTLNSLRAKHKVGLSGTLERKDGLHCVLQDYFGTDKYVGVVENSMPPTAHMYDSRMELSANEFIPWANKITALYATPRYKEEVLTLCNVYADAGHKVLFLSDRTEMLEFIHEQTKERSLLISGKVVGIDLRQNIMDTIADAESGADILCATQSIFSEGVSLNELSCVILATPINNEPLLVQIAGRIIRRCEDKLDPIIVDIGLKGNTGTRHKNNRKKTYIDKGWKINFMGEI